MAKKIQDDCPTVGLRLRRHVTLLRHPAEQDLSVLDGIVERLGGVEAAWKMENVRFSMHARNAAERQDPGRMGRGPERQAAYRSRRAVSCCQCQSCFA